MSSQDTEGLLAELDTAARHWNAHRDTPLGCLFEKAIAKIRSSEAARGRMEEALEDMSSRLEIVKPYLWSGRLWEGFVSGLLNTARTAIAQREGEDGR